MVDVAPNSPTASNSALPRALELARLITCIVRGASVVTDPLPAVVQGQQPQPAKSDWARYYKMPAFIRLVIDRLKHEALQPAKLAALYDFGVHASGRVGKDAVFSDRRRRRRRSHWIGMLRTLAALVAMMDLPSRFVATPADREMHVRSWADIFLSVWGMPIDNVLGDSRLDRATVVLRQAGLLESFRIHVTDDGGLTYKSRPSYKRVSVALFGMLGLMPEYAKERERRLTKEARAKRKEQRRAAKRQMVDGARQTGELRPVRDIIAKTTVLHAGTAAPDSPIPRSGAPPPGLPDALELTTSGAADSIEALKALFRTGE